jgi:CRISPR type III-A-associated RAMP protein Csm5
MRYRLKCLTPLLVGDGRKLCPIDYMVWKDQVNVLDQWRIFRILAKGPRLDSYLAQLKNAEKLDFASWGGFAQNYAGRRIPFENAAYSTYWNRAAGESLHIPTFATGAAGPYLPATAIKGALRTGMVFAHWRDGMLQDALARVKANASRAVPPKSWKSRRSAPRARTACASSAPEIPRPLRFRVSRSTCCALPRSSRAAAATGARLEAEPARRGGWCASRGEHADVRRNGRSRHHV